MESVEVSFTKEQGILMRIFLVHKNSIFDGRIFSLPLERETVELPFFIPFGLLSH